jgi:hypothetical protein
VLAADGGDDPRSLLRERWLFGELGADEGLADLVAASMLALQAQQHERPRRDQRSRRESSARRRGRGGAALRRDGNLFPSEEPAFVASADVTNRLLAELGVGRRYTATELRLATTGKNFRATAVDLARSHGVEIEPAELEWWVEEEKARVTAYLREALAPDDDVISPLRTLAARYQLSAVSSSASMRLDACFRATAITDLFPPERRFSAEDSLPVPASKPDPAI